MTEPFDEQVDEDTVTPEQWRQAVSARLADLPDEIGLKVQRLEEVSIKYNSFDLICWVAFDNLLIDPDNYAEGAHRGSAAHVEFVCLQCLMKPFNEGPQVAITEDDRQEIRDLLQSIFAGAIVIGVADAVAGPGPADELAQLAQTMSRNELVVRAPGYPHHQKQILSGLFEPFDQELRSSLGFTVGDAVAAAESVTKLTRDKLDSRISWAMDGYKVLERYVRAKRKGKSTEKPPGVPDALLKQLSQVSNRDLRKVTRRRRSRKPIARSR